MANIMNYTETIDYIIKCYSVGAKHDLSVLRSVMAILGDPQKKLRIIHVAGTNGKGSTCAMLRGVFLEAGYSVGMFTSPHLHQFNERFSINSKTIDNNDLAKYVSMVKEATNIFFDDLTQKLSYFELLTACAFLYFSEKKPDYVILEVGLGGRLCPTNIIEKPILSVITSIGLDHIEFLGDTIEEIANEKSGIIKENCPTVLYFQSNQVYNVINGKCRNKNSKLYYADYKISVLDSGLHGTAFSVSCEYYHYDCIKIRLLGEHQINNACTVLLAVEALKHLGIHLSEQAILKGIQNTTWHGRMEILQKVPIIILDGAHNLDGAEMLVKSLDLYFARKSVTMIIGILKDKAFSKMIALITEHSSVKNVVLTKPVYGARAVKPSELAPFVKNVNQNNIYIEDDYQKAVDLAFSVTPKDGIICCAGSLYLVGDVRKYILFEN